MLSVVGPDGHRTSFPFRPPRLVVGRKRPADLALPDQGVSSTHCEFLVEDGWFIVRDLESGNGTYVNERRISEARLRDGDVVRLGGSKLTVVLQGEVRGAPLFSVGRLRRQWPWALGALAVPLLLGSLLVLRLRANADEARLRASYAAAVRAQVQDEPCALVAGTLAALKAVDARIAGRPVPIAGPGHRLSAADRQAGVELLGLYRQKVELFGEVLAVLGEQQQKERDGLERLTRMGARLTDGKDRKISFWAEGQLGERVAKGELFLSGLQQLSKEAARFAALVEAVAIRGEQLQVPELAAFRFSGEPGELLRACQADFARTTSGALGALNALDEE